MATEVLLKYASISSAALCLGVIALMARKRLLAEFPLLGSLLGIQVIGLTISIAILFFRKSLGLDVHVAYKAYFYSHWISLAADSILRVFIIYSVFSLAMKPLQGLHEIGKVIFRWVAGVSIAVSVGIAAGPNFTSHVDSALAFARVAGQVQQGISVLTLCLLLFVCFSTKPLGLTYRSRLFGVTLGLGIMAMTTLVQAAWLSVIATQTLYSAVSLFGVLGTFAAVSVWATYFALPEPERKLILLPTTSPFFFWNRISEALGDAPGHVAIAGFRPEMLAPAEFQMLTAPSLKRIEQPAEIIAPAMHTPLLQSAAGH